MTHVLRVRFGWRCAFLVQLPFFVLSLVLLTCNLNYVISVRHSRILLGRSHLYELAPSFQGQGKSAKEMLKRVDYGGSVTLLATVRPEFIYTLLLGSTQIQVASILVFSSTRYNEGRDVCL